MSSRLRSLGMRVVFLFALVAAAMAIRVTAGKPTLPVALLESFDRACALVEQRVAELEQRAPRPAAVNVLAEALERFARAVDEAHAAATSRLETELVLASRLPEERRLAMRGCIEHHLARTRCDRAVASDPEERAEYDATLDRLRAIRRRV